MKYIFYIKNILLGGLVFLFLFSSFAKANSYFHTKLYTKNNINKFTSQNSSFDMVFLDKKKYYKKAAEYFQKRKRPLHHFIDIGIGATLIESFYPFSTTAYPFYFYLNYRREKWNKTKIPIIFSVQYEPASSSHQIHTFIGIRQPHSYDLRLFYVDCMFGISFPSKWEMNTKNIVWELRLLFIHIMSGQNSAHRFYFKWGPTVQWNQKWRSSLLVQMGIDNHL